LIDRTETGASTPSGSTPPSPHTNSSRELVFVIDPTADVKTARYGFDIIAATRTRPNSLAWNGRSLIARAGPAANAARGSLDDRGASFTEPTDRSLGEAMRTALPPSSDGNEGR